jgi:phospholipid/cholesterol/gamma-HCH transport system substrate-binding protein
MKMEGTKKIIVGIFMAGCLLLFGVGLFLIGDSNQLFTKSFHVYADFAKITGIQDGGKVRVAGMDAGTVTRIDVPARPGAKFRIHFRVVEKLHPIVRQDSVASIQTDGLLGNKYLQIDAGSLAAEPARDQSMIRSTEPFDWGDLMDQINDTVKQVNGVLAGVKDQLNTTLSQIEGTAKAADLLIEGATPQVKSILASADKVGVNLREIVDGIQEGKGTVGGLVKDREVYDSIKRSAVQSEKIAEGLRETTGSVKKIVRDVEQSDLLPEVKRAVKSLQEITAKVKDAVDKFQSASGEGGVGESFQRTLADAHEAMSDLSDNTEALKHNFLFRGFFKRRGFYDLGALTAREYASPEFGKGFKTHRIWLDSAALFDKDAKGIQALSEAGKSRLDEAMTAILAFPRNGPLMIEGFAGEGTPSQQFLAGRGRASRVQAYLIARFRLRPAYTGVISMGASPLGADGATAYKEGVGIVSYYK